MKSYIHFYLRDSCILVFPVSTWYSITMFFQNIWSFSFQYNYDLFLTVFFLFIWKEMVLNSTFDYYIAYHPEDQTYVDKITGYLKAADSEANIFVETRAFNGSIVWQEEIFKNMVASKK